MAKEIERKFLVIGDAWRSFAKGTTYRQGYLNSAKERTVRVRTADLSVHTDEANVKVRDALLDIKTKVGETPEGYEIFQPRGKFQFPVKKPDLTTILSHLGVKMDLGRETCALEEFTEMARRHPDLVPVTIEKMRYGFTVDGIICEYAQVWFNGALLESACSESENYLGMRNAIVALGIDSMPNINYLKAAKRVVGMV
jgi:CYTH domain-containing protein